MEKLTFSFDDGKLSAPKHPILVGVLGSGNLEVLFEPATLKGACQIDVKTSAIGFSEIWHAVLQDFFERYAFKDTLISINDCGATPAIVNLRLDQAAEEALKGGKG